MRFSFVAASVTLAVLQIASNVAAHDTPPAQDGLSTKTDAQLSPPSPPQPSGASPDSEATPASLPGSADALETSPNPQNAAAAGSPPPGPPAKPAGPGAGGLPALVPGDMSSGKCMCPLSPPPPACPASGQPPVPGQQNGLGQSEPGPIPSPSANISDPSSQGAPPTGSSPIPVGGVGTSSPNAPPAATGAATGPPPPPSGGNDNSTTSAAGTIAQGSSFTSVMALAIAAVLY